MVGATMKPMADAVTIRPADVQIRFRDILQRIQSEGTPDHKPEAQLGPFLTVSRQVESGGAEIARLVGVEMGWAVFDRELVEELARKLDLSPELLRLIDETRSNWFSETLLNLMNSRLVLQDSYVQMLGRVMLLAAYDGRVVIVGRGGHHLLPKNGGLRVRIVAPRDVRIESLRVRRDLEIGEAEKLIDALDRNREDFIRRHFKVHPDDPEQYDLVIDTAAFGIENATQLVIRALELLGHA